MESEDERIYRSSGNDRRHPLHKKTRQVETRIWTLNTERYLLDNNSESFLAPKIGILTQLPYYEGSHERQSFAWRHLEIQYVQF